MAEVTASPNPHRLAGAKVAGRSLSHSYQRHTAWHGTPREVCVEVAAWCLGILICFLIYLLA